MDGMRTGFWLGAISCVLWGQTIEVRAGDEDRIWTPVELAWDLPWEGATGVLVDRDDPARRIPFQVVSARAGGPGRRIVWVEPSLQAGSARRYGLERAAERAEQPELRAHLDPPTPRIAMGSRLRLRHEQGYDPARHADTFRVFDHLFLGDDASPITKGPGGKHPHHRGLFVGWNRVQRGEERRDFWHGSAGEVLEPQEDRSPSGTSGPVRASLTTYTRWRVASGTTWIEEERTVDVWSTPAQRLLVDVDIRLTNPGEGRAEIGG